MKIGIIGFGSWVKDAYIPALQNDERAEIVGVSARSESTIESIKNYTAINYNIGISLFHFFKL